MTPAEELNSLMHWMFSEGLLDQQFQQLQMLQDASNPNFVAEVITLFCKDSEIILAELTKLLNQPVVDFQKVDAYVHQLKGSSSRCLSALNVVECEYFRLKDKLAVMLQLEQTIQAYENNKQI
ncbi:histidine-containing phosphotransfer protein 2-like isoform X2 [Zingiber officinale]|uniref:histidine-containing phosphotransfer protein 2-like isoform X2 n=1 Tax=Zingiber officinale TaxID=94328 RepID=UPI001C4C3464|nr:histidine-containing phosphotransfer protein 2-like isoform X2 [Zingiber officinale]